jgi:hypothetical protein
MHIDQRGCVYEDYWHIRCEENKDGTPIMSEEKINALIKHNKERWVNEEDDKK